MIWLSCIAGIEFKDFILGFRQSTFLCTTLKCIETFWIPFIKSGIPASNLGSSEARNPAKFAACIVLSEVALHSEDSYHIFPMFTSFFLAFRDYKIIIFVARSLAWQLKYKSVKRCVRKQKVGSLWHLPLAVFLHLSSQSALLSGPVPYICSVSALFRHIYLQSFQSIIYSGSFTGQFPCICSVSDLFIPISLHLSSRSFIQAHFSASVVLYPVKYSQVKVIIFCHDDILAG